MSQNVSIEHTTVEINGHQCRGFAKEADALQLPELEYTVVSRGADGLMVASSTGNKGGPVVMKFMANSPSVPFFGGIQARVLQGAVVPLNGSITNAQTGASTRLSRGVMTKGKPGQTLGNAEAEARMFTIEFETILENVDGLRTSEPPAQIA